MFLSCILRIDVIIVSNFNKGFVHQSTHEILQYEHNTITPTMHFYHHLNNRPAAASNECNHFTLLKVEKNFSMSHQVYEGDTNSEVNNKKFYDLSHGNSITCKDNTINNCAININGEIAIKLESQIG